MAQSGMESAAPREAGSRSPVVEDSGDPRAEFRALLEGCGVYNLGGRGKVSLTGNDRVRWLNGMVTNNVRDLAASHGVYAFLLNPQGRILGDLYAYNRGHDLLLDTDRVQLEKLLPVFDHYIIMDDVEVADISGQVASIGVAGPKAEAILNSAGIETAGLSELELREISRDGVGATVVRGEDAGHSSYQLWVSPENRNKVWEALVQGGGAAVGATALEWRRISLGIPRYGVDIRERDLPQETAQTRALNFSKGCYVGQEIVERIRSRGAVHRGFAGFVVSGPLPVAGSKVQSGGKDVGEITSAVSLPLPDGDRLVALGYVRREVGLPGREVVVGEAKATVSQLPFKFA